MTQPLRALFSHRGKSRSLASRLAMNRVMIFRRSVSLFALAGIAALASTARPALAQDRAPRLPAEVYSACASKSQGTACTVAVHGREFQGICATDRKDPQLACRPSPPRPRS
jgi:hypothetical protein